MIGDTFKNLKNAYSDIKVSEKDRNESWQKFAEAFPVQDLPRKKFNLVSNGAVIVGGFVVLLLVTSSLVTAAKPGTLLYPVHAVTQEFAKGVTSAFQKKESHIKSPQIQSIITPIKLASPTPKPTLPDSHFHNKSESKVHPTGKVFGSYTRRTDTNMPSLAPHRWNSDKSYHHSYLPQH